MVPRVRLRLRLGLSTESVLSECKFVTKILGGELRAYLCATAASASVQGFDISGYQPKVDFAGAYAAGARFVNGECIK
jgi:hypothetical protein